MQRRGGGALAQPRAEWTAKGAMGTTPVGMAVGMAAVGMAAEAAVGMAAGMAAEPLEAAAKARGEST